MQALNEQVDVGRREFTIAVHRRTPVVWFAYKRAMDVVGATLLLVIFAPVIAIAALAVVMLTRGPAFFAQERVGMHGRRFRMFKLRTMIEGAHEMRCELEHLNELDGPVFKIKNDPRLHPLGSFLRRTSIDELPNLVNVVRGEMSLVGPRPALPSEVKRYGAFERRRLAVPQGITGLWQISGRSALSFDEWMRLDNVYVDSWSPARDVAILLRTIPAVLRRDGAH